LIVCDLDRFKAVNDELGHGAGDAALQQAAATIAASVRSIDAVSRIGGEEFAVLLPDASPMEAYVVAERLRMRIVEEFSARPVPVTASCGLATMNPTGHPSASPAERLGTSLDEKSLMDAADLALYMAKGRGRNCTFTYEGSTPAESSLPASPTK
jgi:diguanylate cyclase (GGDEF)-like protein